MGLLLFAGPVLCTSSSYPAIVMQSTHCPLVPAMPDGDSEGIASWSLREVCLVEPRLPRQCKVASMSAGLSDALGAEFPELTCTIVNVDDLHDESHPSLNRQENGAPYRNAARLLNGSNAEVVCLQYSPGIYGGPGGS